MTAFSLKVDSKTTGGSANNPVVKMNFADPADVAVVTNWYKDQFAAKSVTATPTATDFAGKIEDGDSFTIALTPGAAGRTNGAMAMVAAGK